MKEEEIRPAEIFDEYLRLARKDTLTYFEEAQRVSSGCPACETTGSFAFVKHDFSYEVCPNCYSLFVNPRPVESAFSKYYTESPSSKYWASTFYKETAEARREKLGKPKAKLICETLAHYGANQYTLIDIGGGFGLFAEEIRDLTTKVPFVIEPAPHLAQVCREKSIPVIEKFLEQVEVEDLPLGSKVFVSFELFEHLHNPAAFIERLKVLMESGDFFIFTTLSGTGVDIQVLWEESKSVTPPHHLNFLNPRSVEILFARLGLDVLEVTTPGKLDVDILVNSQSLIKDRFWQTFIAKASEAEKEQWQAMISESGWSSHMMVVCRKP